MTMVPIGGVLGSTAGAPLSQTKGSEIERGQKDSLRYSREMGAAEVAERAAGIGQTEQDEQSSERDADGRRIWERPAERKSSSPDATAVERTSRDATGDSGSRLDLVG